jgi:putative ABC transport system ATP-binding protein
METLINIKNVHKVFKQGLETIQALKGVNLSVKQGEFIAINGHSGSGKSTLLNIIGTLDKPTSGEVQLFNQLINYEHQQGLQAFREQKLGFIFQNFNLNPVLTALENVQMPLLLTKFTQAQRLKKSTEMLQKVGLADRLHHKPKQLSGGQQQRVAVARALVSAPSLLLADEPTANLDSHSTLQLMILLKEMNKTSGLTVLFSSHDERLLTHIDRTITLNDGILQSPQGDEYEVA